MKTLCLGNFDKIFRFTLVFVFSLLVCMNTPKADDEKLLELWGKFYEFYFDGDCEKALPYVDQMMEVDPIYAQQFKGFQYMRGVCRDVNYDKAFEAYNSVPQQTLELPDILYFKWLLFRKAQKQEEKNDVFSDMNDVIYKWLGRHATFEGILKFYPLPVEDMEFQERITKVEDYFFEIMNNPALKMIKVKELIEQGKHPEIVDNWLWDLKNMDNAEAYYLYALHVSETISEKQSKLRIAAGLSLLDAQIALARSIAKNDGIFSISEALYWYIIANQNGGELEEEMNEFKKTLHRFDIERAEKEVLKKEDSYYR